MSKVLVLANLELAFTLPEGMANSEAFVRRKERRLLRLLRKLAEEEEDVAGSLERLELESFSYETNIDGGDPSGYYYNKHDRRAETS